MRAALREPATTQLWLELIAFAAGPGTSSESFADAVRPRLARLFKRVRRDAARFAELDDPSRHRLRKRIKRLRYVSEFAAAAFRAQPMRAFLKRLTPAQEALGLFNDVCVARALFEPAAAHDPAAMFALGWLAHERDDAIVRCAKALAPLRKARPFW